MRNKSSLHIDYEEAVKLVGLLAQHISLSAKHELLGALSKTVLSSPPLGIYKKQNGKLGWIASFTNNFRDNDNPREIISAESQKRYGQMVNDKIVPPPSLLIFHRWEWKIGTGEWVVWDEIGDYVFLVAGGEVEAGCEEIALKLAEYPETALSHGMPKAFIKRAMDDPTIITSHITNEISVVTSATAANKLTTGGFTIIKEH